MLQQLIKVGHYNSLNKYNRTLGDNMVKKEWDDIQKHLYAQDIAPQTPESVNSLYATLGATNTNPQAREGILMFAVRRQMPVSFSQIQDAYHHTARMQGRAIALGDLESALGSYFKKPVPTQ